MDNLGDFIAGSTVRGMWNSNAVAGESITRSVDGSIRIYKNSTATERSSSAGITDTENFDGLTGVHHFEINLSDNTDAGFYAAGNDYFVVLAAATIDGKTINAVLAMFSIENRKPILHTAQPAATFASLTVTGALTVSDGIIVNAATTNRNAITATGNGTGNGLQVQGGATGHGLRMIGGGTSGYGFYITTTSGHGGVSAPSGSGMAGIYLVGNSNGHALRLEGAGTGAGLYAKGGASGPGVSFVGGSFSGAGVSVTTTSGNGFDITPTAGHGISVAANGTDKHGVTLTGGTAGTSDGLKVAPGTGGVAVNVAGNLTVSDGIIVTCSTSGRTGIVVTGNGTGHGAHFRSGSGATGEGLICQALSTNGHGLAGYASGANNGIYGYGGSGTGNGIKGQGGDTSGYGMEGTAAVGAAWHGQSANGYGFQMVASGSNNDAIRLTAGSGGYGINGVLSSVALATALSSGERTAIANEVETQIIDDTDSEKVLEAITNKIGTAFADLDDLSLSAIASAVVTALRSTEYETGETHTQLMQRIRAILYGEVPGAGTGTNTFYRKDGTTVATVITTDSSGNRSEVTHP